MLEREKPTNILSKNVDLVLIFTWVQIQIKQAKAIML